jgi:hypothetical protein
VVWLEHDPTDEQLANLQIGGKGGGLEIQQDTPIRVLHRRTNMLRPRTVHWMKYVRIKPHFLKLWLSTQAGTYIKEFVHGDFGRTTPNVATLLGGDCGQVDILSLDVIEVGLDWPPSLKAGVAIEATAAGEMEGGGAAAVVTDAAAPAAGVPVALASAGDRKRKADEAVGIESSVAAAAASGAI